MLIAPSRFTRGRAMLLAGIRRQHLYADSYRTIPRQWQDFACRDDIPSINPAIRYGVVCGSRAEGFEYMCASEVESFDTLAPELGRMRIHEQRYAVFEHFGHMSALRHTWELIFRDWLPHSGITPVQVPDFELYDERFDVESGSGLVELWFPVAESGK